jgi:hypothetical protein
MDIQRRGVPLRLFAEFLVIVVGVLAALAADRWMQARDDQDLATRYYERLLTELVADSVRLEELRDTAFARGESARELLSSLQGADGRGAVGLYFRSTADGTLPTSDVTFEEMQSTGALQLLRPALRQALFDYYAFAARARAGIEDSRRLYIDPVRQAASVSGLWLSRPDQSRDQEFHDKLRQVPGIEGILAGAVTYQWGALASYIPAQWLPRLSETLALVRASAPR